jgi:hypothetical protein
MHRGGGKATYGDEGRTSDVRRPRNKVATGIPVADVEVAISERDLRGRTSGSHTHLCDALGDVGDALGDPSHSSEVGRVMSCLDYHYNREISKSLYHYFSARSYHSGFRRRVQARQLGGESG